MIIVPGISCAELAKRVAVLGGFTLAQVERKVFPDGELYVRIKGDIKGEEAVVIQSTCRPANDNWIELLFLVSALKGNGAKRVRAVIPYYGYGRQDRIFLEGENASAKTMARSLKNAGADEIIVIDPHFYRKIGTFSLGDAKLTCVSAVKTLIKEVVKLEKIEKPLVVGPDLHAGEMSERAAGYLGAKSEAIKKTRIGDREVEMKGEINVEGRNVVLLDDIISTGRTMIKATDQLKGKAKKIVIACVHGVFAEGALEKLKSAGAKTVYSCDTIPNSARIVSVAPDIVEILKKRVT